MAEERIMASEMLTRLMRAQTYAVVLFVACAASLPLAAAAANQCPWLNEATASGLLDGNATGDYRAASGSEPARCVFTQQSAATRRTLSITVETVADPHARLLALEQSCRPASETLRAIGNEAVFCSVKGGVEEHLFGRVRDQVFTISLASSSRQDGVLTPFALKTRIATAAEQVAGNLY
jgi:hypothetical protein